MGSLVGGEQKDLIDQMDDNIREVNHNVITANEELVAANEEQKKAKKKYTCLVVTIIILIIIAGGIVFFLVIKWSFLPCSSSEESIWIKLNAHKFKFFCWGVRSGPPQPVPDAVRSSQADQTQGYPQRLQRDNFPAPKWKPKVVGAAEAEGDDHF